MSDRTENLLLLIPGLFLVAAAFFLPIGEMLVLSVSGPDGPTLSHFARFLGDPFYLGLLWRTVRLSLIITLICAAIGFPLAYIMAHVGARARLWLVVLVILPLMTSVVIRSFGWMVLLSRNGLVPELFRDLGLAGRGFALMNTETAIVIGMVQVLLPFMALSILGVITRIDRRLEEAARAMRLSLKWAERSRRAFGDQPGGILGPLVFPICYFVVRALSLASVWYVVGDKDARRVVLRASMPVPMYGASARTSGTAWRCMLEPMRARLASSCSRNGMRAAATDTSWSGATSMYVI